MILRMARDMSLLGCWLCLWMALVMRVNEVGDDGDDVDDVHDAPEEVSLAGADREPEHQRSKVVPGDLGGLHLKKRSVDKVWKGLFCSC